MPIFKLNSLDINYEVSGSGPLLILHHGFGSWGRDWLVASWVKALEPYATVLIFDAVGHGLSTRSHNPDDHEIEQRAEVVIALANELKAKQFGFVGFSMGGRVGLELAAAHPERLSMLAIGGMHLLPPSASKTVIERRIKVLRSGRAKSIEKPDGERPGNDALALAAAQEALLRWQGVEGRLENLEAPTLLFCGEADTHFANARESAETIGFSFTSLPETDHEGAFFSSGVAVRSVANFVSMYLE